MTVYGVLGVPRIQATDDVREPEVIAQQYRMQECSVPNSSTEAHERRVGSRRASAPNGDDDSAEDLTIDLRERRDQIRSRERVRDLAEVYTDEVEVEVMLDLVPEMFESIDSTFLEPACGDGNFLVEILEVGVFDVNRMDDAIQKFRYFERKSLEAAEASPTAR